MYVSFNKYDKCYLCRACLWSWLRVREAASVCFFNDVIIFASLCFLVYTPFDMKRGTAAKDRERETNGGAKS